VEKSKETTFPLRLEILQTTQDFHITKPAVTTVILSFQVCEKNQCVGERSQPALLKPAWE